MSDTTVTTTPPVSPSVLDILPQLPQLSNWYEPSTADLLAYVRVMHSAADACNVNAPAFAPANPYMTIGYLRATTESLVRWLERRLQAEERNLLLLDRLAREAAEEPRDPPYDGRDANTGIALHGEL
jgi:hypothetical protein